MTFLMMMVMFVIVAATAVNYNHKQANKAYGEYLLELDEIKKRKRKRNNG